MSEIKYVTPSGLTHYDEKIKEVIDGKDKLKGDTLYYDEDKSELQLKSGENVLSNITIVSGSQTQNNLTTTEEGYALDARQGKVLDTRISALETPTFTQASSRANIESGENTPTILGKIKKYFADLKSHAFNSTVNNLTTTTTGYALDATQGKALNDKIESKADKMPVSAASHNGIYRGINLLDRYTIEQLHTMVEAGDFSDIYIGDYIEVTISTSYKANETVRLLVAHLDYFLDGGSTVCTNHHILFVPEDCFETKASMNSTNTTENGYLGSNMHTIVLPIYHNALNEKLNNHILTHSRWLSSVITDTIASGSGLGFTGSVTSATWSDTDLCLLNEPMVYGTTVLSSSAYDVGNAQGQLALFQLAIHKKNAHYGYGSTTTSNWWLTSVVSSTGFAACTDRGNSYFDGAKAMFGVRPYLLFA